MVYTFITFITSLVIFREELAQLKYIFKLTNWNVWIRHPMSCLPNGNLNSLNLAFKGNFHVHINIHTIYAMSRHLEKLNQFTVKIVITKPITLVISKKFHSELLRKNRPYENIGRNIYKWSTWFWYSILSNFEYAS